jgi:cytochrome c553
MVFAVTAFGVAAITASPQASVKSLADHAGELWETSGHADADDEAFVPWDEDGDVPASCAKCHSAEGMPRFSFSYSNSNIYDKLMTKGL